LGLVVAGAGFIFQASSIFVRKAVKLPADPIITMKQGKPE
jgi:hypothetical protein